MFGFCLWLVIKKMKEKWKIKLCLCFSCNGQPPTPGLLMANFLPSVAKSTTCFLWFWLARLSWVTFLLAWLKSLMRLSWKIPYSGGRGGLVLGAACGPGLSTRASGFGLSPSLPSVPVEEFSEAWGGVSRPLGTQTLEPTQGTSSTFDWPKRVARPT